MRGDVHETLIAVVDDEAALREAADSLLRSAGYAAQCFGSAEEFLRCDCGPRAACLVLDIMLPGMSGLELQRHLAAIDFRIPIVFMTARDDASGLIEARALAAGACAFLHKPFSAQDLLGAVRSGLGAYTKVQ